MKQEYIKPSLTVLTTEMDISILGFSKIPLNQGDKIYTIGEEERHDDGPDEEVDWTEEKK